jgi:hypothetical protein
MYLKIDIISYIDKAAQMLALSGLSIVNVSF